MKPVLSTLFAAFASLAIQAAPTQVIGVPAAPWSYPDNPAAGIVPEYFKFLFEKAGAEMTVRTMPYLRVIEGLKDGTAEATLLIPDAERDTFAFNLCSPTQIRSGLLYSKAKLPKVAKPEDLAGKRIGFLRGTKAIDKAKSIADIKPNDIENVGQGLQMLVADRLDATFISSPGIDTLLKEKNMNAADYGFVEVATAPVALYVSRKSELFKNEALKAKLKSECEGSAKGFMQTLMQKYH